MPTPANFPDSIERAGLAVRKVLLRLDAYSKKRVQTLDTSSRYAAAALRHVQDLDELMVAIQAYEEAVLACLPSADSEQSQIFQMSPAELLAYREADPVYRLGWVRGHKAGLAQAGQAPDKALRLYAKHAALPEPPGTTTFIEGVRRFLAQLNARYGKGPLTIHAKIAHQYGTV
jgi:hypothetical protein